jgi:hypothetical protein
MISRSHTSQEKVARYFAADTKLSRPTSVSVEFVRALFQTIDSKEWDSLQRFFCEDMIYDRPGYEPLVGYERVKQYYRQERVIASGTHFLEGVVTNDDRGACWGRLIGTHKNGSEIDEKFADAYTFVNGKISRRRSYFFRPAV